ncbi:AMP-binding protein [Saccharopolyspora sp. K220]|nr:methyltransferase [Saccharopolyspora soli]MCI2419781.1 AMP-binding protein [Saccharopolyspora soli]
MTSDLVDEFTGKLTAGLHNLYGPTEAAVDVSAWSCRSPANGEVPIGKPIDNTDLHVLDDALRHVADGKVGELYIGGVQLARGYLGEPVRTAHRFVADPHVPGKRLYRTGDLVRRAESGDLVFVGRADRQVKVHGNRIELGEVEAALAAHPDVRLAVVTVAGEDAARRRLVAHVVPENGSAAVASGSADEVVGTWQSFYDSLYQQPGGQFGADFAGWHSSYDGEPIPERDMREWQETTVARILGLRPKLVLEIGVGNGLLLAKIAPQVEMYCGTDVSEAAIEGLRERLADEPEIAARTRLVRADAVNFEEFGSERFDVVVLNSVVQYFPDADYLSDVLAGCLRLLTPDGAVFVGDVRMPFGYLAKVPGALTEDELLRRLGADSGSGDGGLAGGQSLQQAVSAYYAIRCGDAGWERDPMANHQAFQQERDRWPITRGQFSKIGPCAYWATTPAEPAPVVTSSGWSGGPNVLIPGQRVLGVCEAPFGAHPQSLRTADVAGITDYLDDYEFVEYIVDSCWGAERGRDWHQDWVVDVASHDGYLKRLGASRRAELEHRPDAVRAAPVPGAAQGPPTKQERLIVLGARAVADQVRTGGYDTLARRSQPARGRAGRDHHVHGGPVFAGCPGRGRSRSRRGGPADPDELDGLELDPRDGSGDQRGHRRAAGARLRRVHRVRWLRAREPDRRGDAGVASGLDARGRGGGRPRIAPCPSWLEGATGLRGRFRCGGAEQGCRGRGRLARLGAQQRLGTIGARRRDFPGGLDPPAARAHRVGHRVEQRNDRDAAEAQQRQPGGRGLAGVAPRQRCDHRRHPQQSR